MKEKTKRNANWRRGKPVIRFFSVKNDCAIKLESTPELILAMRLDCSSDVSSFASQPESMFLEIADKKRRFSPDFLVEYTDGQDEYLEVHHERFMTDEYRTKFKRFQQHVMKERGVPMRLLSTGDIMDVELANYELICSERSAALSFDINDLHFPKQITLGALIEGLKDFSAAPIADTYHLIGAQVYAFNHYLPLRLNSLLTWNAQ